MIHFTSHRGSEEVLVLLYTHTKIVMHTGLAESNSFVVDNILDN